MLGGHLDGWLPDGHPAAVRGERRQPGLPGLLRPRGDAARRARVGDRGRGQAAEVPHRLRPRPSGRGHQDRHRRGRRVRRGGVPRQRRSRSTRRGGGPHLGAPAARASALLLDRALAARDGAPVHTPVMARSRHATPTAPRRRHTHGHHARPHPPRARPRRTATAATRHDRPDAVVEPVMTTGRPRPPRRPPRQPPQRRRVTVRGVVQGVGFRPVRLHASPPNSALAGHVTNTGEGVVAEVEGAPAAVARFCDRIAAEAPPLAVVESVDARGRSPAGRRRRIHHPRPPAPTAPPAPWSPRTPPPAPTASPSWPTRPTGATGTPSSPAPTAARASPSSPALPVRPGAHDHGRLPDVPRLRPGVRAIPADRRFHAQPVACPDCGPRLRLLPADPGAHRPARAAPTPTRSPRPGALLAAGAIVAVKGLGGYHLACDASDARGRRPAAHAARPAATSRSP